ncbi:hypothetical protein AALP_AAs61543U000200, partial [Arabis alpina]
REIRELSGDRSSTPYGRVNEPCHDIGRGQAPNAHCVLVSTQYEKINKGMKVILLMTSKKKY